MDFVWTTMPKEEDVEQFVRDYDLATAINNYWDKVKDNVQDNDSFFLELCKAILEHDDCQILNGFAFSAQFEGTETYDGY